MQVTLKPEIEMQCLFPASETREILALERGRFVHASGFDLLGVGNYKRVLYRPWGLSYSTRKQTCKCACHVML